MIDPNTTKIPVSLTFPMWRQIGAALEEKPFKEVAMLISEINAQINARVAEGVASAADSQTLADTQA